MKKIFTLWLLLAAYIISAQEFVLIKFSDKPSADTYFTTPTLMLSQKALDRRVKYNIELNLQDVPVEENYVNQVEALGIEPVVVSKWFNGVFAELSETQIMQVENLPFVLEVETFVKNPGAPRHQSQLEDKFTVDDEDFVYGNTEAQVTQLNLQYLHNLGFTGEGMRIAVLDAGFPGVDEVEGFAYLRNNDKIKGGYNFVDDDPFFYTRGSHGTMVLSTMGGFIENQYVGTAIDAEYYLFITEKSEEEIPQEEVWWIAAAERADSLGVDVINTSLGYNEFDDARYNYTYEDMDGQTAFISRGAQIAAEKGMMVVNSAGNSGGSDWHYITAPADGVDVFTIGSVNSQGESSGFSSFGPTPDGRIKPDVSARGSSAYVIRPNGDIDTASGTSFSSPIMAGAMACFIQAFPEIHPLILRQKVRASADHFTNPTNQIGFGIPDFELAYGLALSVSDENINDEISVYPNPVSDVLNVQSDKEIKTIQLISAEGKLIKKNLNSNQIKLNGLPNGIYFMKIELQNGKILFKKIIKK